MGKLHLPNIDAESECGVGQVRLAQPTSYELIQSMVGTTIFSEVWHKSVSRMSSHAVCALQSDHAIVVTFDGIAQKHLSYVFHRTDWHRFLAQSALAVCLLYST